MIEHVFASRNIDRNLEDLILQKAEGIPFFIEEFIKSLKDLKAIERKENTYQLSKDIQKLTIPSTIQDIIMARLDVIPERTKEILRIGAVIEREFGHVLIMRVTGQHEQELFSHLSILKDSELIYERGFYPQSTYIFKHALTREVVYDSILTKRKKQLHEKIAGAMEEIYKDEICYYYGILAGHYIASENYEKGAEYARLEAKRYQKAGLLKDAIENVKKSVNSREKLTSTEENQKRLIDARTTLANYYLSLAYHMEAKEAVEPIVDLAVGLNYQKRMPSIYNAIGIYYIYVEENFLIGVPYLKDVFDISARMGDVLALWFGNLQLGAALCLDCQFKESMNYLQMSLDLSVMANNLIGISHSKSALAMNYCFQGKIDLALQVSTEAMRTATESGDILAKQPAYTNYGASCYYKGHFEEAEKYLLEALVCHEKTSIATWGAYAAANLGWTYHGMGNYDKAKKYHQQCIIILEDARTLPSWLHCHKLWVKNNRILNGEPDINIHTLDKLIKTHEKNRYAMTKFMGWHCIGEIFLHIDGHHMSEAEEWIRRSIEFDAKYDIPWNLGKDYALYADWFKKMGDIQGAKEQLTKAIDLFKECGADGWVTRTQESLSNIA
jgi:tetratricopeptide (TPR) repeat protein